jgi:hypothetical protein
MLRTLKEGPMKLVMSQTKVWGGEVRETETEIKWEVATYNTVEGLE